MKRIFSLILVLSISFSIFSCKEKEKKPYGAVDISYDKVEGINKNGPTVSGSIPENTPPISDKVVVENGPWHTETENSAPPTADFDPMVKDEDVPIYAPEHKD